MNSKIIRNIIITLLALTIVVGSVALINWLSTFHNVSFELSSDVTKITVRVADREYAFVGMEVTTLTQNGTIRLQEGSYEINPEGERIDTSPIRFTVDGTTDTIKIDPDFSTAYLDRLLDQERAFIHQTMIDYNKLIAEYDIIEESLYIRGEWYGGTLLVKTFEVGRSRDTYRIILHKTNDTWQVAASPEIVFSYANYPNIPKSVIDNVNRK